MDIVYACWENVIIKHYFLTFFINLEKNYSSRGSQSTYDEKKTPTCSVLLLVLALRAQVSLVYKQWTYIFLSLNKYTLIRILNGNGASEVC